MHEMFELILLTQSKINGNDSITIERMSFKKSLGRLPLIRNLQIKNS